MSSVLPVEFLNFGTSDILGWILLSLGGLFSCCRMSEGLDYASSSLPDHMTITDAVTWGQRWPWLGATTLTEGERA